MSDVSLTETWKKSSRSKQDTCLEARWKKSSRSGSNNGACVEARLTCCDTHAAAGAQVRDSKLVDRVTGEYHGPVLSFTGEDWVAFLRKFAPVR